MSLSYNNEDICVVGMGSVFPKSKTPEDFFQHLLDGHILIDDLSKANDDENHTRSLYLLKNYYSTDRRAVDMSYSLHASWVGEKTLDFFATKHNLSKDIYSDPEILFYESCLQALQNISKKSFSRSAMIVGMSLENLQISDFCEKNVADRLLASLNLKFPEGHSEAEDLKKKIADFAVKDMARRKKNESRFCTKTLSCVQSLLGMNGPNMLVDAACASSLASFDISMDLLRSKQVDLVISGGIELDISPGSFIIFSKVGAMAEGLNRPFDQSSQGISLGEGVGAFALQRLETALEQKNKIYGIVRSRGSSSDGKSSSLFEPTVNGQMLAYERAYADQLDRNVDYLEGHGTGTPVGDKTELESLSQFFNKYKIPIGSVKGNLGHSRGAAGAASLIKCLKIIEHRQIPPTPYFEKLPKNVVTSLFVNKNKIRIPERIEPIRIGVSSFGFGGANFHVVLEEFKKDTPVQKLPEKKLKSVYICGQAVVCKADLPSLIANTKHKIPPKILAYVDDTQKMALLAVEEAARNYQLRFEYMDRLNIHVVSACSLGLEINDRMGERVVVQDLKRRLTPTIKDPLLKLEFENICAFEVHVYPPLSEDTALGALNNVISGRICNAYNFRGKNINLDSNKMSHAAAMMVAKKDLQYRTGLYVIVSAKEEYDHHQRCILRTGVECTIVASDDFALEYDLPILCELAEIEYEEEGFGRASL